MSNKIKLKSIEELALQFIKYNDRKNSFEDTINTIVDPRVCIKKYKEDCNDSLISNSYDRLIPVEPNNDKHHSKKNESKGKLINFQKLPQKILDDDDISIFTTDTNDNQNNILTQRTINILSNIKIRDVTRLKYNKKLYFPLKYDIVSEMLKELYFPMRTNLKYIDTLKTMTDDITVKTDYFYAHNSILELKNKDNPLLEEFIVEEKTYELIEFSFIIFILLIALEIDIDYLDFIEQKDIISIYREVALILEKMYENIMLKLLFNENFNNKNKKNCFYKNKTINSENSENINNTSNNEESPEIICKNYVDEYFEKAFKPKNNEEIIIKMNDNMLNIERSIFNAVYILFSNLVFIKKESSNLQNPDETELKLLKIFKEKRKKINNNLLLLNNNNKNNNINNADNTNSFEDTKKSTNSTEKITLSKEFCDQYNCFKTIYKFLTVFNNRNDNGGVIKGNNNFYKGNKGFNSIKNNFTTIFDSYKEIGNYIFQYYDDFKNLTDKILVKVPFLPPLDETKYKYTLVLDLDETLVHFMEEEDRAYVQVRPFAEYFINEMSKYFEIVIFTAASEDYADIVLNGLDKNGAISYKLYRRHTDSKDGVFLKDLSKLGRDLNKICIIDNNKDNFSLQPENGLQICSFFGDQNDDELFLLSEELLNIVNTDEDSIIPVIRAIDEIMKKRYKDRLIELD